MARPNRRSISQRTVEALGVDRDTVFRDRDRPGFGIRVHASGARTYIVPSRAKGRSVRVTVDRRGDDLRLANRIKAGEAPVPEPLPARLADGPTVADPAARHMEQHVAVRCRASTARDIRQRLDKHVLPEFGKLPLMAVERERVAAFHARLNGVPCAAIRLLMLTGCRKSGILSLRWRDADLEAGELRLPDSRTGPRAAPLSPPAAKVLADLPRIPDNPSWMIPGQKPGARLTDPGRPWRIVRKRTGIEDARIHDLRCSSAIDRNSSTVPGILRRPFMLFYTYSFS